MKYVFIMFFVFLYSSIHPQNIKKAFESYEKAEYKKAMKMFYKIANTKRKKEKDKLVACYYVGDIFAKRTLGKKRNIDSSYTYFIITENLFANISKRDKDDIFKRYGISKVNIKNKKEITSRKAFNKARKINTKEAFEHFIKLYNGAQELQKARIARDEFIFGNISKNVVCRPYKDLKNSSNGKTKKNKRKDKISMPKGPKK